MGAPVKHTCNNIDASQKQLNYVIDSLDNELTDQDIKHIRSSLNQVIDQLEDLRSDNSKLRDWGEDLENKLSKAESDMDEALTKIEDLEKECTVLEKRCEILEAEIESNLNNDDPVI